MVLCVFITHPQNSLMIQINRIQRAKIEFLNAFFSNWVEIRQIMQKKSCSEFHQNLYGAIRFSKSITKIFPQKGVFFGLNFPIKGVFFRKLITNCAETTESIHENSYQKKLFT